jgi:hypothetical protein
VLSVPQLDGRINLVAAFTQIPRTTQILFRNRSRLPRPEANVHDSEPPCVRHTHVLSSEKSLSQPHQGNRKDVTMCRRPAVLRSRLAKQNR